MSVILTFFLLFCQTLFSPIFYLLSFFLYFSMITFSFLLFHSVVFFLAQNMIRRKCCNIQPYNDVEILRINLKIKSYYKLLNF